MKAIILLAHGSRRPESNEEVTALAAKLAERVKSTYRIVRHGFAEIAEPKFVTAVQEASRQGATEITVIPYFLAKGTHVANDVPRLIAEAKEQTKGVEISLTPHVGEQDFMINLLEEILK